MELLDKFILTKSADELRVVYGFASVIEVEGEPVVDTQGDIIPEVELEKAAHEFIADSRVGGFMHSRDANGELVKIGQVVASMPLTRDVQKAFGMDLPVAGWAIGMKILDEEIWKAVKEGKFAAFSIGGEAIREPVDA